MYIIKE